MDGLPMTREEAWRVGLRLVEETRASSLWFYGKEYLPEIEPAMVDALRHIERPGVLEVCARARTLRQWLSPNSTSDSADESPRTGGNRGNPLSPGDRS